MATGTSEIEALFLEEAALAAYNTALTERGLAPLAGLRRHRRLLKGAARYPLAAVELGEVTGQSEGVGGLRSLRGRVTLHVAFGAADADALLARAPDYVDALREAVEGALADAFQSLHFAGARPEGEPFAERGVALRIVPLWFEFVVLYTI